MPLDQKDNSNQKITSEELAEESGSDLPKIRQRRQIKCFDLCLINSTIKRKDSTKKPSTDHFEKGGGHPKQNALLFSWKDPGH